MNKKVLFLIGSVFVGAVAYAQVANTSTNMLVGGDRDAHGCIGSAGYVWSTSTQNCVRPWEQAYSTESIKVGCFIFSNNLKYGQKGDEVRDLQEKLKERGYLSVNSTGYFGPATLKAVKKYQKDNGVSQTGFVGEKTRGILRNHFCGGIVVSPIDPVPPVEASASCKVWYDGCNTCIRSEVGGNLACTKMACVMGGDANWFTANRPACREYFDNTNSPSPVVKSFGGPTTLKAGEKGIWNISANISDNSRLTYEITWEDEVYYAYANSMTSKLVRPEAVTQNTTFEHVYNQAGTYTVTVRVVSESGKEVKTSQTITVVKSDTNDTCKVWYDGCNTCSRSYPGAPMACTLMACMQNSVAYCKESF